jgi:hypothetical protein
MATQKFMGKNSLIDRLASQVGSRDVAIGILQKRGQADAQGNLTSAGKKRDAMTAEERALDRASKSSGKPSNNYVYDPRTNRAKLKG